MADDGRNDDQDMDSERHPALRNFNETSFKIKYFLTNALKWGGIAAVAGATLIGAFNGLIGLAIGNAGIGFGLKTIPMLFAAGPWGVAAGVVGILASPFLLTGAAGAIGGSVLSGAATGLTMGGIGGALIGAVMSFSNVDEAMEQEKEKLVARYEQMRDSHERKLALAHQRNHGRAPQMDMDDEMLPSPMATRGRGGRSGQRAESMG